MLLLGGDQQLRYISMLQTAMQALPETSVFISVCFQGLCRRTARAVSSSVLGGSSKWCRP